MMMLHPSVAVGAAFVVLAAAQPASAAAVHRQDSSGATLPHAQGPAAAKCTRWHDVLTAINCGDLLNVNELTMDEFMQMNPSVGPECEGVAVGKSYCVDDGTVTRSTATPASAPSKTKRSDNGINTPRPIQPDMVPNCDAFYLVKRGERCVDVAAVNRISVEHLTTWNRAAGPDCTGLWGDTWACVSVVGHEPPAQGFPSPVQRGIAMNCNRFRLVQQGQTCIDVAAADNVSLDNFLAWNPAAGGRECGSLWAHYYACTGVSGG
ncbi:hypothetical protein CDD83_3828 [Cordyceps sp. RAO-2017]|nr:hypothetical protein CDD83_3828 [Cordyceps sp. RAO-2017]